ncbi:hypothetical protein HBI56_042250 [Parastagonospora nodorum]|uniref:CFEM domain-containing protein n=2 Tax=Phaeosphaeria nodorum (strain SN15 / ATCC MYA-4574 / FGSC 10173) TaxID=321614 RepID=A0A7U2EUR4_PHANO|nr:hypothetical protein HBH56_064480 [Parastagonospora nodorum]QRC93186.1 hypothetical protein JI435_034340 [Parastagonospora nodorum SN15]KAH3932239.1 hypothetical protein HBH54_083590 [Parastagonospora nodorum]KAH4004992.1 hypothetical protein HBI10_045530 [Parastagonospora nodorum]KAH4031118.1 hypothetical protein HBI13_028980 [Parastagonospora nodorum]
MTMRMRGQLAHTTPRIFITVLLLIVHIQIVFSIPQSLFRRQSDFAAIQLPSCALTCFVKGVLTDGCANETDFACHCGRGDIIGKQTTCVRQGCNQVEAAVAFSKVRAACRVLGGRSTVVGESWTRMASSAAVSNVVSTSSPSAVPAPNSSQAPPTTSSSSNPKPIITPSTLPTGPSSTISSTIASSAASTSTAPVAQAPPDQLSDGAKAGIAVSVSSVALSIFSALGWYIRRLKRKLRDAQEQFNDGRPSSLVAPARRSSSRRGRRTSISPLSSPMVVDDSGYGAATRKRAEILSVVVEADEELGMREPVPGQSEGLTAPLELEAAITPLVEAPLAVTPRERSRERNGGAASHGIS